MLRTLTLYILLLRALCAPGLAMAEETDPSLLQVAPIRIEVTLDGLTPDLVPDDYEDAGFTDEDEGEMPIGQLLEGLEVLVRTQ